MTAQRIKFPFKIALLALIASGLLCAQETRKDIVNPSPNPADDAKENNASVPDVYALTGHFDRIVILRFKYKTDLLAGMEKMVKQEHIRNGVILSAAGSVRGYHVHQVSNRTMPSHDTFEQNPTQPADLLACMEKMVKQEHIRNGVILSAAGSVRGYHVHQVSNRT